MNELDLVRTFRERVPEPDPAAIARARQAVMAGRPAAAPRRRRLPAGARWLAAGVVAAGTAAALVLATSVPKAPERTDPTLALVLDHAAGVAASRRDPGRLGPGRYYYARSLATVLATTGGDDKHSFSVLQEVSREFWVTADGSGRIKERTGRTRFVTPKDKANWERAGRPDLRGPNAGDERFGPGELGAGSTVGDGSYASLLALPTDPAKLYALLRKAAAGNGRGTDVEMFVLVSDLLRETPAPPALQAAAWRVAAMIPGVDLLGPVTDRAGRHGTGIAKVDRDGVRTELFFDEATATPLGERETLTRPLQLSPGVVAPAGTVIEDGVMLRTGVVGGVDQRP